MKTYQFYLKSANHFLNDPSYSKMKLEEKEYVHFAGTIMAWICLESYINAISESLSRGTRLKPHEKAFLLETELRVNDEGNFHEVKIRPSTTKKILFIIHHFTKILVKDFKKMQLWRDLKNFEDIRNKILHHKDTGDIKISLDKAQEYRNIAEETISFLNSKLFRKR